MAIVDKAASAQQLDAVMRASQVLLGIVSQSVAEVEDTVSPPQLRVLVLIATRGPQTPGAVAADLGIHASNGTRLCDRLVAAGLVERQEKASDRRYLQLELSTAGRKLVQRVMDHRRQAIAAVLQNMDDDDVESLAASLDAFAEAAAAETVPRSRFELSLPE